MTGVLCDRGHRFHSTRRVDVELGGPTPYADLTPIPLRCARRFPMDVWDTEAHPIDGVGYCPAADRVSETVASLGVWSPDESTLILGAVAGRPGCLMVDVAAGCGWFTLLAVTGGVRVAATDPDADNVRLMRANVNLNGATHLLTVLDPSRPVEAAGPVRAAHADIDTVARVVPAVARGLVDTLLVSDVPAAAAPVLVSRLAAAGMEAYVLPDKRRPPVDLTAPAVALGPYRVDNLTAALLADATLANPSMWFRRAGAEW